MNTLITVFTPLTKLHHKSQFHRNIDGRREDTPQTCIECYIHKPKSHPVLSVEQGHVVVIGDDGPYTLSPGIDLKHLSPTLNPLLRS